MAGMMIGQLHACGCALCVRSRNEILDLLKIILLAEVEAAESLEACMHRPAAGD